MTIETDLDPDFASDERIFHYTSSHGLYGILGSKCLWATHFQFLNDSNEFYAARESLIEFVRRELHKQFAAWKVNKQFVIPDGENLRDLATHEATVIVNSMYEVTYERLGAPFIFSGFCCNPAHQSYQNGGLLHWAMYGKHGGYAIRLNPHKIRHLMDEERARFPNVSYRSGSVIYSKDVPDKQLKSDYETIAIVAKAMVAGMIKNNMESVDIRATAAPFWRITSMYKDAYFKDEAEARIIVYSLNDVPLDSPRYSISVRHGDGVSVPYIEVFKNILLQKNCPIEAIIVGPHPQNSRRVRALQTYMRGEGLSSIEIIESKVPYIG